MTLPQHLSASENYITPKFIVDAYREVLGTDIALDPATSVYNNYLYVKASNIYTEETNGLEQEWKASNVFLNFPSSQTLNNIYRKKYGDVCCKVWFNKFAEEFNKSNFYKGLIVLFSNSHLNILDFSKLNTPFINVCTLRSRVKYEVLNSDDQLEVKTKPTHYSSLIFVSKYFDHFYKFSDTFKQYGNIWLHHE